MCSGFVVLARERKALSYTSQPTVLIPLKALALPDPKMTQTESHPRAVPVCYAACQQAEETSGCSWAPVALSMGSHMDSATPLPLP